MAKESKILRPLTHYPSTHTELATTVELAGWANSMVSFPFVVRGEMAVDTHACGLIHFTLISHGWAPQAFATRFFGAKIDEALNDGTWVIPKGSRFYVHPTHIRALTMAPKEEKK